MQKNDSATMKQIAGVSFSTTLLSFFSYLFQYASSDAAPSFTESMKGLQFIDAIINASLFHLEQIALILMIFAILSAIIFFFRLSLSVALITITATLLTILLCNIFSPSLLANNLWLTPLIFTGFYLLITVLQKAKIV